MKISLDDQLVMKRRTIKMCCGQICKQLENFHTGSYFITLNKIALTVGSPKGISKREDKVSNGFLVDCFKSEVDSGG